MSCNTCQKERKKERKIVRFMLYAALLPILTFCNFHLFSAKSLSAKCQDWKRFFLSSAFGTSWLSIFQFLAYSWDYIKCQPFFPLVQSIGLEYAVIEEFYIFHLPWLIGRHYLFIHTFKSSFIWPCKSLFNALFSHWTIYSCCIWPARQCFKTFSEWYWKYVFIQTHRGL